MNKILISSTDNKDLSKYDNRHDTKNATNLPTNVIDLLKLDLKHITWRRMCGFFRAVWRERRSVSLVPSIPLCWWLLLVLLLLLLLLLASQAKSIYHYKSIRSKVIKCNAYIFFNKQCLAKNIIPKYANIKVPATSKAAHYTQKKVSLIRIKDEIKFLYMKTTAILTNSSVSGDDILVIRR
jgi:hypothetical protein